MSLLFLPSDKVLGSFITAFIGKNLVNQHSNFIKNNHDSFSLACQLLQYLAINNYQFQLFWQTQSQHFFPSDIAIAMFPLMIYNYHNPKILEKELAIISNNYSLGKIEEDSIKIIITIVNLILTNELEFSEIIGNLTKGKDEIKNYLQLIEEFIKNHAPLTQVEEKLSTNIPKNLLSIYQSIYCFFSFPDNLKISLQRSSYFAQESEATAILTGYLLGLYHGYINIPYQWRTEINFTSSPIESNLKIKEIEILTEKLVANWQGKMDN
ncbi:MAG: hypothetical protein GW795_03155 [Cyanobacteria bacterium]|nr:hypothetical protein [Cyanobacteria bacterium CG_2015-16_32_12]NCO78125.1 hypothetical protein [Cyanobacteria bacterium CG_2015-22_32_23]NCQ04624.1 hypothetical protein [Cyanobacteria bacterium CG_2015-09_32_10]NCQ40898.1 hypothetical protein [Cyanobacteria bacterium CG_2015-04_32_10]NCS84925.1 hypothetical protein [Cyanobacteria bacterium CG_2015-02_32_10]